MAKKKPKPIRSWIVRMRCVVIKDVIVTGCSEGEARDNHWEHSEEETEVEQLDWEVLSVEPNE